MTHILNDMENSEQLCLYKETRNKLLYTYKTICIKFRKILSVMRESGSVVTCGQGLEGSWRTSKSI